MNLAIIGIVAVVIIIAIAGVVFVLNKPKTCAAEGSLPESTSGKIVTAECGTGKTGTKTSVCGVDGKWTTTNTCKDILCPSDGTLPESSIGKIITKECGVGKTGLFTNVCGADGKWKNTNDCKDIVCPARDGVPETKYDATSVGTCPAGTVGRISGTCGADGVLRIEQTCKPGIMGRYVKLTQPNKTFLHIAELQVISDGVNVAKGVPAVKISSVYSGDLLQGQRAVDADLNTYFHTKGVGNESIEIDLAKEYPIHSIVVYNRWDDMNVTGRIAGSFIEVFDNAKSHVFTSDKFAGKNGSVDGSVYAASNGWYKYTISPPAKNVIGS